MPVEIAGADVFGIYKQTYASGLVSNENSPLYRFSNQKGPVSLALMLESYREAGEAHRGKVVFGIYGGVRKRTMFCFNLAKRKGEESQDDDGLVSFSKDKGAREPFFSMLPGCGLEKDIQFRNSTIKDGAIVFTGKWRYFKHRRFFLC